MKTSHFLATALLASTLLSACAKSNNSVDSEGNCTDSFITDYNAINHEKDTLKFKIDAKIYTESEITSAFQSLSNVCQKFYSNHSNVSCRAQSLYGGDKTAYSSDHRSACDAAEKYVREASSHCNSRYVDEYNWVLKTSSWLKYSLGSSYKERILRDANSVKDACSHFFTLFPNTNSCKAVVDGITKSINGSDLQPHCELADRVIRNDGAVSTSTTGPISPVQVLGDSGK